jgi:hypothetical protein
MATIRPVQLEPRRTLWGSLAAFGTRRMVRYAQWRARRDGPPPRPSDQMFRGFVQINVIRPG